MKDQLWIHIAIWRVKNKVHLHCCRQEVYEESMENVEKLAMQFWKKYSPLEKLSKFQFLPIKSNRFSFQEGS